MENHQTQQQMKFDNSFCIQGLEKLEKAQVLQINLDPFTYNQTSGTKQKIISIEQEIFPDSQRKKKETMLWEELWTAYERSLTIS